MAIDLDADMTLPLVKHTKPCRECPFRRVAPKGWLGGGTVEEWHGDIIFGDTAFACHMAEAKGKRHFCAGSMIHMRNSLKMPRSPEFVAAISHYEKDHKAVFSWPHEFQQHHADGLLAQKKPAESAVRKRGAR